MEVWFLEEVAQAGLWRAKKEEEIWYHWEPHAKRKRVKPLYKLRDHTGRKELGERGKHVGQSTKGVLVQVTEPVFTLQVLGTSKSVVMSRSFPDCSEYPGPPHLGTQRQPNTSTKGKAQSFSLLCFIQDLQQNEWTPLLKQGSSQQIKSPVNLGVYLCLCIMITYRTINKHNENIP